MQAVSSRSTVGKPTTSPAAFSSGVASRTSAIAMSRSSFGLSFATAWIR